MDNGIDYPCIDEMFIYTIEQFTIHGQLKCDITLCMESAK